MPLLPQTNDFMSCAVCLKSFSLQRKPITLSCCHTCCSSCLKTLNRCPFDQTLVTHTLPENEAIISLTGTACARHGRPQNQTHSIPAEDRIHYEAAVTATKELAALLKPSHAFAFHLSRPLQRKLISLLHCQLMEPEGRVKAIRASRSIGERAVAEFLIRHQDSHSITTNLWAAVRSRGCQFLGPAMQEEVLKLVLLALGEDAALSRKVLVMFVVQRLSPHFPHQSSKTAIGHVIQLLYRASCFKLTKREGDSSLMQLKNEYASYEALRREHDTQLVSIAVEAGLRISPEQWSSLLYGDTAKKAQMQSIIDKLQSPHSFNQSIQELAIALTRTGDPAGLAVIKPHLEKLASIDMLPGDRLDSSTDCEEIEKTAAKMSDDSFSWAASCLQSACIVTLRLVEFLSQFSSSSFRGMNQNAGNPYSATSSVARPGLFADRTPVMSMQAEASAGLQPCRARFQ